MSRRVFVYGSLRAGEYNHVGSFAKGIRASHGVGVIHDAKLFSLGCYPCIVTSKGDTVVGEVYDIDDKTFAWVERMELGAGYDRRPVTVSIEGEVINADAYFHRDVPTFGTEVASGDWSKRDDEAA